MTLGFAELISPEFVIGDLDCESSDAALTHMSQMLVDSGHCRESFVQAILERERVHPSGLPMSGHKIAIPHTDAHHVRRSAVLFARLNNPVAFRVMGSPDQYITLSLVSMFALREQDHIGDMLETLISVYQRNEILDEILHAPGPAEMYTLLRTAVERYGN